MRQEGESIMEAGRISEEENEDFWIRNRIGGKKLEDEYLLGDIIGRGVSSVVRKCLWKGRTEWACKIIKKKLLNKKSVQVEIGNLLELKHPNIVQIKEVLETPSEIQLILELAEGGELFERIVENGSYTEEDAAKAVKHALHALQYLHGREIVHGDLKPENLLYHSMVEDSPLKITDFGLCKMFSVDHEATWRSNGAFGFHAPEMNGNANLDPSVDLWSLGVVTYVMLCGIEPFREQKNQETTNKRMPDGALSFPSPWWDEISDGAKELISKMLSIDPKRRPTATEALNHPWILGISTSAVLKSETIVRLKEFNARRRFRVATTAVIATQIALSFLPNRGKKKISDGVEGSGFTESQMNGEIMGKTKGNGFDECFANLSPDEIVVDGKSRFDYFQRLPPDDSAIERKSPAGLAVTDLSSLCTGDFVGSR